MRDANTAESSYQRLPRLLRSAGSRMFRAWSQSRVLLLTALLLSIAGAALIGSWLFRLGDPSQIKITLTGWTMFAVVVVAVALASPWLREHAGRISIGILSLVFWIPAQLHLVSIDRVFLSMGRLDRFR